MQKGIKLVGKTVVYTNGQPCEYTGKIVAVNNSNYIVLDCNDEAAFTLYNMGYAVGSEIAYEQIKRIL